MDLKNLRDFKKDIDYHKCCTTIKNFGLSGKMSRLTSYVTILESMCKCDTVEERWFKFYDTVIDDTKSVLTECADYIANKHKISREKVVNCIVRECIYKKFVGLEFEISSLEELLNSGFEIIDDNVPYTYINNYNKEVNTTLKEYLDTNLAIDLRVKNTNDEILGIQFKSESYIKMSHYFQDYWGNYIKETHYKKHCKAIQDGLVNEVYYMFHQQEDTNCIVINNNKLYQDGSYLIKSKHVTMLDENNKKFIKYYQFQQKKPTKTAI